MKKVMVFGTFNVIHPGHLNLFRQAKEYGDKLIVVLAKNETVQEIKRYSPIDEIRRRQQLLELKMVDEVVYGELDDKLKVVKSIQPDVICLGYDQVHFVQELEAYLSENNLDIPIIRLKPYRAEMYKSSKLVTD